MKSHGLANYDMTGLTYTDKMGLVGRGMSASTLVLVSAACLRALGFLVKESNKGEE